MIRVGAKLREFRPQAATCSNPRGVLEAAGVTRCGFPIESSPRSHWPGIPVHRDGHAPWTDDHTDFLEAPARRDIGDW